MSVTKGYKAEWLSIDDLSVILAVKGFAPTSSITVHKAMCNILAHGGDIEQKFKLNELSANISVPRSRGNYNSIRILHPNNKFFKGNGVVLVNEKYCQTSWKNAKKNGVEPIKGFLL